MVRAQDNKGAPFGGNAARVERESHHGKTSMIISGIHLLWNKARSAGRREGDSYPLAKKD
jgi:hypothetical protein